MFGCVLLYLFLPSWLLVKQCIRFQVLFCSTEVGRTSFVRQLEADFHIDTSLDIVSQLSVCYLVSYLFMEQWFLLIFMCLHFVFIVLSAVHSMPTICFHGGRRTACSQHIHFSKSRAVLLVKAQRKDFRTPNVLIWQHRSHPPSRERWNSHRTL